MNKNGSIKPTEAKRAALVTRSQRIATILGRLAGMAASIYFWFILNNHGSDHPIHQSVFIAVLEGEESDKVAVLIFVAVSTIIVTVVSGFISRLLFSFRDE